MYLTEIVAPELLQELTLHIATSGDSDGRFAQIRTDISDALQQVKTHVRYGDWESPETRNRFETDVNTVRLHQSQLRRTLCSAVTELPYWVQCEWSEPIDCQFCMIELSCWMWQLANHLADGDEDRRLPPDYPRVMRGAIQGSASVSTNLLGESAKQTAQGMSDNGEDPSAGVSLEGNVTQGISTAAAEGCNLEAATVEPSATYFRVTTDWLDNDNQWHDDQDPKKYAKRVKYSEEMRRGSEKPARVPKEDFSLESSRPWRKESYPDDSDFEKIAAFSGQDC